MSMNEFERQNQRAEQEFSYHSLRKYSLPSDFSEDDFTFAEKLNALFSPEMEEIPPYYVPTLLDSDDQRFESVERGFEYKMNVQVFRRLKLRRHLFNTHTFPHGTLSAGIGRAPTRRSLLVLTTIFVCVMLLTVAFTGPAFASGVALLLRGTHGSGTYQTQNYPLGMVRLPSTGEQVVPDSDRELSLQATQQQLHFSIYWPQTGLPTYSLNHVNLYPDLNQQWVDGPTLEFVYNLLPSAAPAKGTGEIWIREFKPKADILQLVGASEPVDMDSDGKVGAIYVDGQWEIQDRNSPVWVSGQRSELVYQLNGVIFWIVGDQRDGIGEPQLEQIALGLTPDMPSRQFRMMASEISVQLLDEDVPSPFSNDVIMVYTDDGSNGPYYMSVSSYVPSKSAQ